MADDDKASKTAKKRGPYKQWLRNEAIPIPKSTVRSRNKKRHLQVC